MSETSENILEPIYSLHKRVYQGNKIGICSINTAWRANSDDDKGNLLFPPSLIQRSLSYLDDCECKILLCHHSLHDLSDFNATDLEDLIYQKFHFMFSGHIHKTKQLMQITADEGIFCCVSPATLSMSDKTASLGYTVLDIDLESYGVEIKNNVYLKKDNVFLEHDPIQVVIPMGKEKAEQNEFRKTLKKRFLIEAEKANDIFISGGETEDTKKFLELFSKPVLRTLPKAEISDGEEKQYSFRFDQLIGKKENIIIYGQDKSGKTSLLKKVLLDTLKSFNRSQILPYYIDCNEYKLIAAPVKILSKLARYCEVSQKNFIEMTNKFHIKLLIDNFDPHFDAFNFEIKQFLEKNSNCSLLATAAETIANTYDFTSIKEYFDEKLYIYDISRNEIRSLTNKWPNIPSEKIEDILEKIVNVFKQIHIPFNYWTVSLFLWIFEKTSDLNFHNNVELIELYIDNLLERKKLALKQNSLISFDNFKTFLGELAKYLITIHEDKGYCATYGELIGFTENYRKHNVRFVIGTDDIIGYIIDRGIIYKRENSLYTFRLKGIFEYFIAYHMKNDKNFRDSIISEERMYPAFANEIELYAGFSKKDIEFLNTIYSKTRNVFSCLNDRYELIGSTDQNLVIKLEKVFDMTVPILQIKQEKQSPLDPKSQDRLLECIKPLNGQKTEVEKKSFLYEVKPTSENFERFLFILSRVYRNIDMIDDENLIDEIFDYILKSFCNLGFALIDDMIDEPEIAEGDEESAGYLLELITNFIPLIIQIHLYDGIAHINLTRVIEEKLSKLKNSEKRNQFKLFLLYFLLIDLNVYKNIDLIDELLEYVHLDILKSGILLKLYSYLMFKSHNRPNFEKKIRNKIQTVTLRINKKADLGSLHRSIEQRKRRTLRGKS